MRTLNVKVTWLDNYSAHSDEIPGVIATNDSFEGVQEAFIEALEFHIEGLEPEELEELPFNPKNPYRVYFEQDTQALLKSLTEMFTLSAISRYSKINEKQLGHYLAGIKQPRSIQKKRLENGIFNIKMSLVSKTEKIKDFDPILKD